MKSTFFIAVLFAACVAQPQNLKIVDLHFPPDGRIPPLIHFMCSTEYKRANCVHDTTTLREAMAPYPLQLLGEWSFVLVPADDWRPLVRSLGGDPVSPAGSILDRRVTILDETLFSGSPVRNKELLERFRLIGPGLLDLAITHEFGHAVCQETDERRADDYGRALRDGKTPDCSKTRAKASVSPRSR